MKRAWVFIRNNAPFYYDRVLKHARLKELKFLPGSRFWKMNIVDQSALVALFRDDGFIGVAHLQVSRRTP